MTTVTHGTETPPKQPITDAELEAKFAHPPTPARTAWRVRARNDARALFAVLLGAEGEPSFTEAQKEEACLIRETLKRALEAAVYTPKLWEALKDWYSGASIETAWSELHSASEHLLLVEPAGSVLARILDIQAALQSNLKSDDPRLAAASKRLKKLAKGSAQDITDEVRQELCGYQPEADLAGDEAHKNVRSLRNLLIAIGGSVTIALVGLAILHAVDPHFIDLATVNAGPHADAVEVWQVEAVGALGGLIAAIFTISKLGGFAGPYRLPAYQALIRVPAGSAVALGAVILIQSHQVKSFTSQNGLGILAVALLFGYAPDVLLRFMDQKGRSRPAPARQAIGTTRSH